MHRHPQWFPDADRFDPERFAPESHAQRPAFSYLPFGGGGRRCLGESFAELEGILVMATVASRVRFRLVDGQTISPDPLMTLRPHLPIRMTVSCVGRQEHYSSLV
jgi:cytochrome P450